MWLKKDNRESISFKKSLSCHVHRITPGKTIEYIWFRFGPNMRLFYRKTEQAYQPGFSPPSVYMQQRNSLYWRACACHRALPCVAARRAAGLRRASSACARARASESVAWRRGGEAGRLHRAGRACRCRSIDLKGGIIAELSRWYSLYRFGPDGIRVVFASLCLTSLAARYESGCGAGRVKGSDIRVGYKSFTKWVKLSLLSTPLPALPLMLFTYLSNTISQQEAGECSACRAGEEAL